MQHGRAFARVVIAHRHDDPAMRGGACHIGMAHHVTGPVHPRPFAIPETEHAIMRALTAQFRLLAAPKGGRGKVFVQPGLKQHVVLRQQLARAHHLTVDRTKRRAAIPGHKPRRVEPRRPVAGLLHKHQPHKRLRAVQKHMMLLKIESIRKTDFLDTHRAPPHGGFFLD